MRIPITAFHLFCGFHVLLFIVLIASYEMIKYWYRIGIQDLGLTKEEEEAYRNEKATPWFYTGLSVVSIIVVEFIILWIFGSETDKAEK